MLYNATRICSASLLVAAGLYLATPEASAYPEFQMYVQQNSGRNVNCAMCHAHGDGPEGLKPGQIGSLSPEGLQALNRARTAFEPGQQVENPILNEFGNHIMTTLGKREVLLLRQTPAMLADALGYQHDLDSDGISDANEYLAGTLATDPNHGPPWQLFWNNLRRYGFHLAMIVMATLLGLYGINNLFRGFEQAIESRKTE